MPFLFVESFFLLILGRWIATTIRMGLSIICLKGHGKTTDKYVLKSLKLHLS